MRYHYSLTNFELTALLKKKCGRTKVNGELNKPLCPSPVKLMVLHPDLNLNFITVRQVLKQETWLMTHTLNFMELRLYKARFWQLMKND